MFVEPEKPYRILETTASYGGLAESHEKYRQRPEKDDYPRFGLRDVRDKYIYDQRLLAAENFIVAFSSAVKIACLILPDSVVFEGSSVFMAGRYYRGAEPAIEVPDVDADRHGWAESAEIEYDFGVSAGTVRFTPIPIRYLSGIR